MGKDYRDLMNKIGEDSSSSSGNISFSEISAVFALLLGIWFVLEIIAALFY